MVVWGGERIEIASAYETLSHPVKRKDYDLYGRRVHSRNSEETLSQALGQIFAEFMAGDFENLLLIVDFINTQNPDLAINKENAQQFFHQVRDVIMGTLSFTGCLRNGVLM